MFRRVITAAAAAAARSGGTALPLRQQRGLWGSRECWADVGGPAVSIVSGCSAVNMNCSGGGGGVVEEMQQRGLVADTTSDRVAELFATEKMTAYCGFDPTAATIHVGNLVAVMALVRLRLAGHNIIALVGGATGQIGDPSGRTTERIPMSREVLDANVAGIESTLERVCANAMEQSHASTTASAGSMQIVNNLSWYEGVDVVQFLSTVGRHFRINSMLAKESVKSRLEGGGSDAGMSFTEFAYQIFQANDFLHLYTTMECSTQIGGSDQWGNITAGCELIKRSTGNSAHGITLPLVTTSDGVKFGKSMGNAVWLDAEMTSCYSLYQFFFNTADADVVKYLKLLTLLDAEAINVVAGAHAAAPGERAAQRLLAREMTRLIHGDAGVAQAEAASAALFSGAALRSLDAATIAAVFADSPHLELLHPGGGVSASVMAVAVESGLFKTKKDAKRTIAAGGLYMNNVRVETAGDMLDEAAGDLIDGTYTLLRRGKKDHMLVKWVR